MKNSMTMVFMMASALLLNAPAFASAGGAGGGNGGDSYARDTGAAWFLGADKKIRTCYQIYPGFPVTGAELEAQLLSIFQSWNNYTLNLQKDARPDLKISMDVEFVPCDGSQELAVYLGTDSSTIDTSKNQYQDPIAFAQRTEYDDNAGRGRGFVWVKMDNWNSDQLHGILLHEIGHVLGCAHVEGTIMDSEIATMVGKAGRIMKPLEKESMYQIDQSRFLEFPYYETVDVNANFPKGSIENTKMLEGGFEDFAGRAPVGEIKARFYWDSKTIFVTLSDDIGRVDVALNIVQQLEEYVSQAMVFKTLHGSFGSYMNGGEGFSWLLSATTRDGKNRTAILNVNGSRLINLNFLDDQGKYELLFASDYTL